jgi:hypothetical protein
VITFRQAVLSDIDQLAFIFNEYRKFYGRESGALAARQFLLNQPFI